MSKVKWTRPRDRQSGQLANLNVSRMPVLVFGPASFSIFQRPNTNNVNDHKNPNRTNRGSCSSYEAFVGNKWIHSSFFSPNMAITRQTMASSFPHHGNIIAFSSIMLAITNGHMLDSLNLGTERMNGWILIPLSHFWHPSLVQYCLRQVTMQIDCCRRMS